MSKAIRWQILALVLAAAPAAAQIRVVGGGALLDLGAPVFRDDATATQGHSVYQMLYTSTELQIPAGARIIDVAFRKEGLQTTTGNACTVELWMKNVTETSYQPVPSMSLMDATTNATRVYQGVTVGLPSSMGFVRLYPNLNTLSFDYTGGSLEVLVTSDCQQATTTGPIFWRYDAVADRVRSFASDQAPTAATLLQNVAPGSAQRVQTQFTWLATSPAKKFAVRAGIYPINAGGNYAAAAKNFAAGVGVPQHFTLWNFGVQAVTVQTPVVSATNGTIAVTSAPVTTLGPGQSAPFDTLVTPATAGAITINTSITTDDPVSPTYAWTLQGTAGATSASQPNLALVPDANTRTNVAAGSTATVNVGVVPKGQPVQTTVQASNYGAKPAPTSVTATPGTNVASARVDNLPASIGGQEDDLATLVVDPLGTGIFDSQFVFTIDGLIFTIDVTGEVAAPEIDVSRPPATVSIASGAPDALGSLSAGTAFPISYLVKNTGLGPLTVGPPTVSNLTNCTVTVKKSPTSVAPRGSAPLDLELTPTGAGPFSAQLSVPNDDSNENPYVLQLSGVGTSGVVPKLVAETPDGYLPIGTNVAAFADLQAPAMTLHFGLHNAGDGPLEVSGIIATCTPSADLAVSGATFPATLAPGESTPDLRLTISFPARPSKDTDVDCDLSILSNDPETPAYHLSTSGRIHAQAGGCASNVVPADGSRAVIGAALFVAWSALRGRRRRA